MNDLSKRCFLMCASVMGIIALSHVFVSCLPISPPPPVITNTLTPHPEGYNQEITLPHSNLWANLASVFILVAMITISSITRKLESQIRPSVAKIVPCALLSLGLWLMYGFATESLTVFYDGHFLAHAYGHRYVIGIRETEVLVDYLEADPGTSMVNVIDDFPGAIDRLWTPKSVYFSFVLLGLLYIATATAFATTLLLLADVGWMLLRGKP